MPETPKPPMAHDGHQPLQKGWAPKVQGGFKPQPTATAPKPPTGGSGVKAPKQG